MIESKGIPIKDISWEHLKQIESQIVGWIYPRRNISPFIPAFTRAQQAAINLYGWIAIFSFFAGIVLPFFMSIWWLVLVLVAIIVWRANRKSMEQFFLKNLLENRTFYEEIRQAEMGEMVRVVLRHK